MQITIFIASLTILIAYIPQFIEAVKKGRGNLLALRAVTLALMVVNAVLNLLILLKK